MTFSRDIAARTLWMEADSEPEAGQRAVAHAMVNRVKLGKWGPNLASVCLAPYQFSAWNTKDANRLRMAKLADDDPLLLKLAAMIQAAATGESDPTQNSTHYYNPDIVPIPPDWTAPPSQLVGKFGSHLFYRNVP